MKNLAIVSLVALMTVTVGSSVAFAGTRDPKVNHRQYHEQTRIRQGVKSGELTKKEAIKLQSNQRKIARTERRMKSDGNLSAVERAKLDKIQDKQSKVIYNQKHDEQDRP